MTSTFFVLSILPETWTILDFNNFALNLNKILICAGNLTIWKMSDNSEIIVLRILHAKVCWRTNAANDFNQRRPSCCRATILFRGTPCIFNVHNINLKFHVEICTSNFLQTGNPIIFVENSKWKIQIIIKSLDMIHFSLLIV